MRLKKQLIEQDIKHEAMNKPIELESTITCPKCNYEKMETMPTDACAWFYQCEKCNELLKPLEGDCCVYCSYGTVPCPPIQEGGSCGDSSCC
jgi:hypothetical protein